MAKLIPPPTDSQSLFPILPSGPVGLARLAAEATHADDGHLIEFKAMKARSLLNHSVSKRMGWVAWSINPYRGCEFGCRYCYARYTHQFLQPDPVSYVPIGTYDAPVQPWAAAFEHEIYLKENAAWASPAPSSKSSHAARATASASSPSPRWLSATST